jgi:hypothetical protein
VYLKRENIVGKKGKTKKRICTKRSGREIEELRPKGKIAENPTK